ncbi:MAG: acyltransferase family protein [Phycisphaerales bacterium]
MTDTAASASPISAANGHAPAPEAPRLAGGKRGRIAPLDGVRGLAVCLVFLYHCTVIEPASAVEEVFAHVTFLNGLSPLLFFVLSGFLITGILVKTRDDPHFFRTFYIRRALRIFPLYYAVLVLSFIVLPTFFANNPKVQSFGRVGGDVWMYWVFLQNFGTALAGDFRHGILDVTWSLAIEEQFYFVWPLLVYVLSNRALARVCVGLIAFGFLYRCTIVFVLDAHPITAYVSTFARVGSLGIGSLLALGWKQPGLFERLRRPAAWAAALTVPFIWVFTGSERLAGIDFYPTTGFRGGPYSRTLGDIAVLFGLAGLVITCLTCGPQSLFSRVLGGRFFTTMAVYSYGVFLFHTPIRAFVRDMLFGPGYHGRTPMVRWPVIWGSQIPAQLMFYCLVMAITFPLAYFSYHLWEKHWAGLKSRVKYQKPGAGDVVG